MAVASNTEIANLALARLGDHEIANLATDTTKAGRIMRAHYEQTRDLLLRAHPWNWAIKRATLAASATAPNHEFAYAFPLPTDCLKIVQCDFEQATVTYFDAYAGQYTLPQSYRIEVVGGQRCIVTDESACKIEYIAEITDVAQFDPLFVDLFASRLAAECAYAITQSRPLSEQMWQLYEMKWRDATATDAQEGTPRPIVADAWLGARF